MKLWLDVDGVLNIWPPRTEPDWPDGQTKICMGYPIFHSRQMGERLAKLDVDFHWLTSWGEYANQWIGPLFGWDPFPVGGGEFLEAGHWSRPWWKLKYMWSIAHDGPFVWVDDEMDDDAEEWAESLPVPTLLIRPETHLTMKQLDMIEDFVKITCV